MKLSNISMLYNFNNFGSISYANVHMHVSCFIKCWLTMSIFDWQIYVSEQIKLNKWYQYDDHCLPDISHPRAHWMSHSVDHWSAATHCMCHTSGIHRAITLLVLDHHIIWSLNAISVITSHCSMSNHFRNFCYIEQIEGSSAHNVCTSCELSNDHKFQWMIGLISQCVSHAHKCRTIQMSKCMMNESDRYQYN